MTDEQLRRALIINRLPALRATERRVLFDASLAVDDYRRITIADIEFIVNRRLRPRAFARDKVLFMAEQDYRALRLKRIRALLTERTPFLLQQIADPPFLLFARGHFSAAEDMILAVVGTRRPSAAAARASVAIGEDLAREGITMVSGLAYGVDCTVMRAAVGGGAKVLAVLGNGIDYVYPAANRSLAARIIDNGGAVLSEYSPGVAPMRHQFPARNRIISGLARAVLVVEAPRRSGALITAHFALEQGRDLFVHEISLSNRHAEGSNALIDDGAEPVSSVRQIRAQWGYSGMEGRLGEPAAAAAYREPAAAVAHREPAAAHHAAALVGRSIYRRVG